MTLEPFLFSIALISLWVAIPTVLVFYQPVIDYLTTVSDYNSNTGEAQAKICGIKLTVVRDYPVWFNPKTGRVYITSICSALNTAVEAYKRRKT